MSPSKPRVPDGARAPASDPRSPSTQLRQHPERGRHDRATIDAILDAGLVCHVGIAVDGQPLVIPMGYARDGDRLLLHGATTSRLIEALASGAACCLTVTHLDGLVLARSPLHHSMNYRSVMVQGRCHELTDPAEKQAALERIVEQLVPGRGAEVRASTPTEVAATRVVALPLGAASAKLRSGPPIDAARDIDPSLWAGVLPITLAVGNPIPAADLAPNLPAPASATLTQARFPAPPIA
ncbi:MAG: pyridoxamine 5'-phosphate oxidase family protein [Caldilineae bacterium]|nr:pyridoxamine 5'-phosphate oxidase family protein [Caldilineae bacterium]